MPPELDEELREWGELEPLRLIDRLRQDEGSSVTILCDNPDFNGLPNNAVECCGDWTDFKTERFTGDTLLAALRAADEERYKRSVPRGA